MTSDIVNQISAYAAKQKRQAHRKVDNSPTPERVAKAGMGFASYQEVAPGMRPHRDRQPMDVHKEKDLTAAEYNALRHFLEASMLSERSFGVMNYDGATSRGSGSKLGGLGNVNQQVRNAVADYHMTRRSVAPFFLTILDALVAQVQAAQMGKALSTLEFARGYSQRRDKATLQGLGIGLLKSAAQRWAEAVMARAVRERALTKRPPSPAEDVDKRRAERMERVRG